MDQIVFLPNKATHHYLRWLIHSEILDLRSLVSRAKHQAGVDLVTELTDLDTKGQAVVCLARLLRQFIKGVLRNSVKATDARMDSLGPADFYHTYEMLLEPMLIETVRGISFMSIADAMLTLDQRQERNGEH